MKEKVKNAHAVALGRKGGEKRKENLSKKELSEIGKKGAAMRWKDKKGD